ncbi:hypothetical protein N781_15295 [Pontibacillus halophilus JSM 076056 = DSM 19796]|uniref:Hydrolase n=1 Tax=Pontibacillus halophilus JSM 076056 = DSM 19796 TaxID=1385510 RepID=A0A0A5GND8_9BACI|nr:hypothetical protein [Pontibacillus halophilus]KGX92680.1 hypothetical protein N781_15295 [Pontibacillus halophilus JSM 076056 = DSM 19796]
MHNSEQMMTRTFTLDGEPCLIHVPEKPNGFAVLYIGDSHHYVESDRSFWMDHPTRSQLLYTLLDEGYTLFTTRLYEESYGSERGVYLLNQMYQAVRRQEIVNPYIHVVAEGMGALNVLRWQQKHPEIVRSNVFFSPCTNLKEYYGSERVNQLYFKRLRKQVARAYEVNEKEVQERVIVPFKPIEVQAPVFIFHDIHHSDYDVQKQSRPFEESQRQVGQDVHLHVSVPPLFPRVISKARSFLKSHETDLQSAK